MRGYMEEIIFYDYCIKSAARLLTEKQLNRLYRELIEHPEKFEAFLLLRNLYLLETRGYYEQEAHKTIDE